MIAENLSCIPFPVDLMRSLGARPLRREKWHENYFPALLPSGQDVRRYVRSFTAEASIREEAGYILTQIVDELASNAIKALHTDAASEPHQFPYGAHFGVRLGMAGTQMFAQVWDPCPVLPEIPEASALDDAWLLAEHGRGLALVRALSSFAAVVPHLERGGVTKSVIATVPP